MNSASQMVTPMIWPLAFAVWQFRSQLSLAVPKFAFGSSEAQVLSFFQTQEHQLKLSRAGNHIIYKEPILDQIVLSFETTEAARSSR